MRAYAGARVWLGEQGLAGNRRALASYAKQALRVFRKSLRTGKRGRPKLVLAEGIMVAKVKKRYERRRVVEVIREVVRGTEGAVHS